MIENIPCVSIYDRLHAMVSRELSVLLIELTKKRAKASRASFLSPFPITLVSLSAVYRSNKWFFFALLSLSLSLSLSRTVFLESDLRITQLCRNFSLKGISRNSAHPPVYFNSYRRIPPLAPRLLRSGYGKFVDRPLALTDCRSFFSVCISDRYLHPLVYRHLYRTRARAALGARRSRKNHRTST